MKFLLSIIFLVVTSHFCRGQSNEEKSVYSMKKDMPVITEVKSETKMISNEELQSRTSFSIYKSHTSSSDTEKPVMSAYKNVNDTNNSDTSSVKSDKATYREPKREIIKSSKNPR